MNATSLSPRPKPWTVRIRRSLAALFISLVMAGAHGAESVELTVTGTIHPPSCTLSLSHPALDFGVISANDLKPGEPTALPPRTFTAVVSCPVPSKTALRFSDNREGTEGAGAQRASTEHYGLGAVAGKPLGYFLMESRQGNAVADGGGVYLVEFISTGAWRRLDNAEATMLSRASYRLSWAQSDKTPTPVRNVAVTFIVTPTIAARHELPPLDQGVPIDGSATLALVYL